MIVIYGINPIEFIYASFKLWPLLLLQRLSTMYFVIVFSCMYEMAFNLTYHKYKFHMWHILIIKCCSLCIFFKCTGLLNTSQVLQYSCSFQVYLVLYPVSLLPLGSEMITEIQIKIQKSSSGRLTLVHPDYFLLLQFSILCPLLPILLGLNKFPRYSSLNFPLVSYDLLYNMLTLRNSPEM